MKRSRLLGSIIILTVALLVGCGGGSNAPAADSEEKPGDSHATRNDAGKGTVFENDFFSAVIPDGWTVFDDSKVRMMRIYPEGDTSIFAPTLHLKFEGNGNWGGTPEAAIQEMVERYSGSDPEKTVINGLEYVRTTYEHSGSNQTMLVAKKNGNKITLTLVGRDYESNPDLAEILDSISIK